MSSIYRRGRRLWFKFKDVDGRTVRESSGLSVGQEQAARKMLAGIEREIGDAAAATDRRERAEAEPVEAPAMPTLAQFADGWVAERRARGVRTWKDDRSRLDKHLLPRFGSCRLDELRVRDVREFVGMLKTRGLAPRTVRHVYNTLRGIYRDAMEDEVVTATPCLVGKRTLPPLVDKDPAWRVQAVFSRSEIETLISDQRIPLDRRLIYSLISVGGLRTGEAAGLRWQRWDPTARPLGRLEIVTSYDKGSTKTGQPRMVPVHPALATLLSEWKLSGWAQALGRTPQGDDLILPVFGRVRRPDGAMRTAHGVWAEFRDDLKALGLRHRRVHDLRRTMISLARADGARSDLLEVCTHGRRGSIVDVYTEFPWEALCGEVAKLRIERRAAQAEIIELRVAAPAGGTALAMDRQGGENADPGHSPGHSLVPDPMISRTSVVSPTGFEPVLLA